MYYALGAALALAAADLLMKAVAGKLPDSLAMLFYGMVPCLTGLVWVFSDRFRWSEVSFRPPVVAAALGVGVMFTSVTFCMYAGFRAGAPLSLASPLVRLGGLVFASAAGLLLWKEPLTARYVAGMVLVLAGMWLILSR